TNVTAGNAPLTVQFNDTSINLPTSWDWNFGDGSPDSYSADPVYTYNTPGVYNVSLNVSNSAGSNQTIIIDYIMVNATPVPSPSPSPSPTPEPVYQTIHETFTNGFNTSLWVGSSGTNYFNNMIAVDTT